jgi:tRNA 2-selenouridine synthase
MPFTLIVLNGLAGTSKTELIKKLSVSIDLEGIAKHRSSTFGSIGLNPRTQKMFDSYLLQKLKSKFIYKINI